MSPANAHGFCGKGPFGEKPPVSCRLNCSSYGGTQPYDSKECEWRNPILPSTIYSALNFSELKCTELSHSIEGNVVYTKCRCGLSPNNKEKLATTAPSSYMLYSTEYPASATMTIGDGNSITVSYPDSSTNISPGGWQHVEYPLDLTSLDMVAESDVGKATLPPNNFKDVALKKALEEHDEAIDKIKKRSNKHKKKDRFELLDME